MRWRNRCMTFIDRFRPPPTALISSASSGSPGRTPTARRLALAGAVGLTAVSVAACGSTGPSISSAQPADPVTAVVEPSASPAATPSLAPTSVDIDQTFWHSGFEVTLGQAVLTPTADGADVVLAATFVNDGPKATTFPAVDLVLESAGVSVLADGGDTDRPTVPGSATGTGAFAFHVHPEFDLTSAVLTIGNASGVQSIVSLGSRASVTNEPIDLGLTSLRGRAGSVRATVTDGVVRSDDPLTHRQLDSGHALIDLTFDVRRFGGANTTTFIGTDNLALRLPDGTTVAVRGDGLSNPGELLAPGASLHDLHVRFEVPASVDGRYALVLKSLTTDAHHDSARLPFQVDLG